MSRAESITMRRLVVQTLLITPSGALSPGPLSLSALAAGLKLGVVGGLLVATGHMMVELPYIIVLVKSLERIRSVLRKLEKPLAVFMLAFILYFAYLLVEDALLLASGRALTPRSTITSYYEAVVAGIIFTGANPYFLLWWVSVGLPLIRGAAELGSSGVAGMYTAHVWMDYAWLGLLAAIASSVKALGGVLYAYLLLAIAVMLIAFGIDMILRAYAGRRLLPF